MNCSLETEARCGKAEQGCDGHYIALCRADAAAALWYSPPGVPSGCSCATSSCSATGISCVTLNINAFL
ncbi:hypothetical protein J6590_063478 [Homalodisca vitripennis]|nr:hypothetical protein J6590_063478 [Homalodisca vitripennis]